MIDLNKVPAPAAVETLDFEALLAEIKADLVERHPDVSDTLNLESEPLTKLLETWAYREMVWRARLNLALLASTLTYSTGDDLDVRAADYDVERKDNETDDELRSRCLLSLAALSVAGPTSAYRYHALSADARVADAKIYSPAAGVVRVVLMAIDDASYTDLAQIVYDALSADTVRPLCDTVEVTSATKLNVTVDATLYLTGSPDTELVEQAARNALDTYMDTQRKIGATVSRSGIYACLHQSGVNRVDLRLPASDIQATRDQYPTLYQLTLGVAYE